MKDDVVILGKRVEDLISYFLESIKSRKTNGCPKHSDDSLGLKDLEFLITALSILRPHVDEWNRVTRFVLEKAAKCLDYSHYYTDVLKSLSSHVSPEVKASIVMHFVDRGEVEPAIYASAQTPSYPLSPMALVCLANHHRTEGVLSTHCDWSKLLDLAKGNQWALNQVQQLHAEACHCEKNRTRD